MNAEFLLLCVVKGKQSVVGVVAILVGENSGENKSVNF